MRKKLLQFSLQILCSMTGCGYSRGREAVRHGRRAEGQVRPAGGAGRRAEPGETRICGTARGHAGQGHPRAACGLRGRKRTEQGAVA